MRGAVALKIVEHDQPVGPRWRGGRFLVEQLVDRESFGLGFPFGFAHKIAFEPGKDGPRRDLPGLHQIEPGHQRVGKAPKDTGAVKFTGRERRKDIRTAQDHA